MRIARYIFLVLGFLFTGLACIGVFFPVMPTTPFLLLAVFFFSRSSQRWRAYLLNHKIFGQYLTDYYNHEMTLANKGRTIATLWIGMLICMWLVRSRIWISVLLGVIAVGVTIHLVSLRSAPPRKAPTKDPETAVSPVSAANAAPEADPESDYASAIA